MQINLNILECGGLKPLYYPLTALGAKKSGVKPAHSKNCAARVQTPRDAAHSMNEVHVLRFTGSYLCPIGGFDLYSWTSQINRKAVTKCQPFLLPSLTA